jgi:hypothetical protein
MLSVDALIPALTEAQSLCWRVLDYRRTMRDATPATINAHEVIHQDLLNKLEEALNRIRGFGGLGGLGGLNQAP